MKADLSQQNLLRLVPLDQTNLETTLTLASAHALVLLEDGVIGDPMEKTTVETAGWTLTKGTQDWMLEYVYQLTRSLLSIQVTPSSHHQLSLCIEPLFKFVEGFSSRLC